MLRISLLVLAITTSAFAATRSHIQFRPDEIELIRQEVEAGRLSMSQVPLVKQRLSEIGHHPDRLKLAMSSTWRSAFARDFIRIGAGLTDPTLGWAIAFDQKGIAGGIGQAVAMPFRSVAAGIEALRTGQALEKPVNTAAGMIVFAAIIALVFVNKPWVKATAAIAWFVGLIASSWQWPLYLIASAIIAAIALMVRWIIRQPRVNN